MIINGDSAEALKEFKDNSIDAVITDPPYGIEFLGKEWDQNTGAIEIWRECLRVLKPGGHLLAFSAARTYHHLATNIEQVGFEIRDQIMWIYASGFPKAQDIGKAIQRRQGVEEYEGFVDTTKNVGFGQTDHARVRAGVEWSTQAAQVGKAKCTSPEAKQWAGWKTALKPAHEPIVMARKPMKGSTIDNVLEHGVGALNIDATRVPWGKDDNPEAYVEWMKKYPNSTGSKAVFNNAHADAKGVAYVKDKDADINKDRDVDNRLQGRFPSNVLGEIADHQKYFYCPKVSRRERHRGFDIGNQRIDQSAGEMYGGEQAITRAKIPQVGNNHPTVKPVELMKYLIKLVTPPGSHILDPFSGSGSTGMACKELGRTFTGIDLDENYCEIAKRRISATQEDKTETLFEEQE